MSKIAKVISGGQSGADRGAMDAARACDVPVGGWCPAGGWAEDMPEPPGIRALYPQMVETPSADVAQRTEWNIRDATCCIVLNTQARGASRGTDIGYAFNQKYGTPCFEIVLDGPDPIDAQIERACVWLAGLDDDAITVSFGGPRASEYPGIYGITFHVVEAILGKLADPPAAAPDRRPILVGITGGSGSGKTVFAERLRERIGADAIAISHDDYYKDVPQMTVEEAAVYDFDSPDALDTWLLVEHLHALMRGEAVEVPSYDFASHARTDGARPVEPVPVILVEGLLIMCDPDLLGLFDLTVFIDVEPDIRVIRRLERDCAERGTDLARAIRMYLEMSKPAHDRYVEPFKRRADIVISGDADDAAVEAVAERIAALRTASGGTHQA